MPNLTRQQVADQLNNLQKQGATEQQISNFVSSAGYTESDFNTDLNGTFRPFVVGTGTSTQLSTFADSKASDQYYASLTSSASVATNTNVKTSTTTFEQSVGGGTTTIIPGKAIDTPESISLQARADSASTLASAYGLNPDTAFGARALDRKLAEGTITQAQYDDILSLDRDQRLRKAGQLINQASDLTSKAGDAKIQTDPTVITTVSYNNSSINVTNSNINGPAPAPLKGTVPGSNVTTTTINGVNYQVVPNDDGATTSYTPTDFPNGLNPDLITITEPKVPAGEEVIDPNTVGTEDPIEAQRVEAEQKVNRQELERQDQADINPEADPFAAQQAEAEARLANDRVTAADPIPVGTEDPFEEQRQEAEQKLNRDALLAEEAAGGNEPGTNVQGATKEAQSSATSNDAESSDKKPDWRVRLSLAQSSNYLYNVTDKSQVGILSPLRETNGVIFPYTPTINVSYNASYDTTDLVHSNYRIYQYKNSHVDTVTITGDFTAQDTGEANYLLAVIHFFRSVTKMFYGRDQNPRNGTPPPLVYLSGLGTFQFDNHPLVVTGFTYQLPNDVDYIRAGSVTNMPGQNVGQQGNADNTNDASNSRLTSSGLVTRSPNFQRQSFLINSDATYVPTRISITVTCLPIVSRNDISNTFSLEKYATGALLQGSKRNGGGIW